ncbi:MAG: hypothetical protein M1321_00165 [Candidatus Marsarchaeota archaeon]|nr:hypothetical protein [Candidatus Marsarchaeota archaeon]
MIGARSHGLHGRRRGHLTSRNVAIAAVLVILFAGIAFLALSSGGAISASGNSQRIGVGSTLRFYLSNGSVFSVFLSNSSNVAATLYMSPYPILTNPITRINGAEGQAFNISTSGSQTADINLNIVSSNSSAAVIKLTQLPSGLNIKSSSLAVVVVPGPLPSSGQQQYIATTSTASTATTTVSSANELQSTTTVAQSSNIPQSIINLAEASNEGVLMKNLSALYAQEPECTEAVYNQTVRAFLHSSPTGPESYANVTAETPTSTNTTITLLPSGLYQVNYSVTVPEKRLSGTVISMEMDSSGNTDSVKFLGIFQGLNYTAVENAYKAQSAIGNACAAYVQ